MLENAYLIPLIPAISFVVILAVGKRLPFKGSEVGIAALGVSWLLSLVAVFEWIDRSNSAGVEEEHAGGALGDGLLGAAQEEGHAGAEAVINTITWWSNGDFDFTVGTLVDGLTVVLLFVVTTISLLIHIYSVEYVKGDVRFTHFFAFLSLFTASMLMFVMAENLIQMLVGWELVGLCSFVLIGHWWEEKPNSDAAVKAFLTNRVGDVGLIIGVIVLFWGAETFSIEAINVLSSTGQISHLILLVASIALMTAVMSKSGQFPLHTWLPDAMAGPTPVSALIHAATMVVAGIYLVARLYPVFYEGFSIGSSSINEMAFIGGFTALIGAGLAFAQWDIKKVLAYSTVSQLGYMVMALGVGAWTAAIFHLVTHAFFKACLFLGAGSVSHASHHTFDIRKMGGLRQHMPHTFWTFIISTLALAGIFPLAGFWSKDEILVGAQRGQDNGYPLMLIFGLVVALMTAAYMTRVVWYTFFGEYRGEGQPHESPKMMTVPLWILAGGAVFGGLANLPSAAADALGIGGIAHRIETWAEPVRFLENFDSFTVPAPSLAMALIGLAFGGAGILIGYLWFWRGLGPHGLTERNAYAKAGYTFLEQRYYLDHLYTDIIVGSIKKPIAKAVNWFDQHVVDRAVNEAGTRSVQAGQLVYKYIDQGIVDNVVDGVAMSAQESGQGLRVIQSGKVQQYGALLFGSAAILAILFVILI